MPNKKSRLPKEITTVTPLSKALALMIFIVLPFIGFVWGAKYSDFVNSIDRYNNPQSQVNQNGINKNIIEKTLDNNNYIIKMTVYGKIVSTGNTDNDVPYNYKIVLDEPITDKDAITDASGIEKPKYEYVLYSRDEKINTLLKEYLNNKVEIKGLLDWGMAETRHLKIDSIKLL